MLPLEKLHFYIMALIEVLKSKIHRAKVTEANLNYVGSITLDEDLMDAAGLFEYEKVTVVNVNNGERLDTYVIKGKRKSGVICLNGAAARKCQSGDLVIVMAYTYLTPEELKKHHPKVIMPDSSTNLLP